MTTTTEYDKEEGWRYAEKVLSWCGWGSPVGLGLFIVSIGAFVALLHEGGLWR
jgi:hypothetical protein